MIRFISIFLAILSLTPYVMAIDCKLPSTAMTQVICGDYRLSRANEHLEQLYQQQALKTGDAEDLQKSWLASLEHNCEAKKKDCLRQQYEQHIRELSQKTWQFPAQIHPELASFQFELVGIADEDTAHVQKIIISNQDGYHQTLIIEHVSDMLKETETLWLDSGEGFKIEDVNFDGYKDIRLMELLPAGANVPYLCWLYQPEQKQFEFNKQYSQLAHLTLDIDKKQVISQYRINAVEHGIDYYSVNQYKLILIRQELLKYVKNKEDELELFELVKERVGDELQITSQKLIQ
ncbi:hypothetical protein [Candidatus Albibeggiatoa sp. nov. BB20]|uniref:lysozyme inhibitor LprI family protein n=1 Tax=Candidatus Albibeggiatoa sp. nov. BB20 TaxID=3162723 RepID=UPI0033657EF6